MDELLELIRIELRLEADLQPTTPLLSSGMVDSLSVVILLSALEERFGVVIDESVVSAQSFDTPQQIHSHISSLLSDAG